MAQAGSNDEKREVENLVGCSFKVISVKKYQSVEVVFGEMRTMRGTLLTKIICAHGKLFKF